MNTVKCNVGVLGFNEWITVLSTEEARGSLIEQGEEQGKVFLLKNTNP
jgi:hypothetical protein